MHWDFALILLFLGTAVPWLGRRRVRQLMQMPQTTKQDRLRLYASTIAFQCIAAGVILWRTGARRISLASLGFQIPNLGVVALVSVLLAALILVNQLVSLRRISRGTGEQRGILPELARKVFPQDFAERLVFLAVVMTVSLCEEVIYRGFAQYAFGNSLWGSVLAGVLASAALFALAHAYQGAKGIGATFIVGILFSAVRSWTGSLLPPILAHFLADFTAGMLAPSRIGFSPNVGEGQGIVR
ncbi:MAG TPA: CPBP family intramembrane glutamic endopeptidase [Candidatus Acidoferrales bacterium]|nr:CPBP family intramembrane glutamic endopeptidase [Candidatus Acidoferrales bacterium]